MDDGNQSSALRFVTNEASPQLRSYLDSSHPHAGVVGRRASYSSVRLVEVESRLGYGVICRREAISFAISDF